MESIRIRPAVPQDREAAVLVEGLATPGLRYLDRMYDPWLSEGRGPLLVAEMENRLVGVGKFTVLPDHSAWLETLRVDPAGQGMGVGKALYRRFMTLAEENDVHTVRMYTNVKNAASKGLAALHGFSVTETFLGASLAIPEDGDEREAQGFVPVTDATLAGALLEPAHRFWAGYGVMNRTFYRLNPAVIAHWAEQGCVYSHPGSDTTIVLGARFLPEQGLHLAAFAGNPQKAVAFAVAQARSQGAPFLKCMFPESASPLRTLLSDLRFSFEPECCMVMEASV